jgi:hypothetical protein
LQILARKSHDARDLGLQPGDLKPHVAMARIG